MKLVVPICVFRPLYILFFVSKIYIILIRSANIPIKMGAREFKISCTRTRTSVLWGKKEMTSGGMHSVGLDKI